MRVSATDLRFIGPLPEALWKRFRRRRVLMATTATIVAAAIIETEPNLTGIWQGVNDPALVMIVDEQHGHARATFRDGELAFEATYVERRALRGIIRLSWIGDASSDCGEGRFSQPLGINVAQDYSTIQMNFRAGETTENCNANTTPQTTVQMIRIN